MSGSRTTAGALALVVAAGCARTEPVARATEVELLDVTEMRLAPTIDGAGRRLGRSIAVSDDGAVAIVGAPEDAAIVPSGGAAHVFTRTGAAWTERAVLRPPAPVDSDGFGSHVAVSGDGTRVAVGAPGAGASDSGAVFVFVVRAGGAWTQEAVLVPTGAEAGDETSPVALDRTGATLVVGVPGDTTPTCTSCGTAVVFVRAGAAWSEDARLVSPTPASFERFGHAVDLTSDGAHALIGVPREDTFAIDVGAARVFSRTGATWAHEALLSHGDAVGADLCGLAVAIAGDGSRAIMGCPLDDSTLGANTGTARIFVRGAAGAWAEEETLSAPDAAVRDQLGLAVDLRGDGTRAAVGAPGDPTDGTAEGTVRVHDLVAGRWIAQETLSPAGLSLGDAFGRGVALSADGTRVVVGVDAADTAGGLDAGAAWSFSLHLRMGAPCGAAAVCASGFCVDGVCCESACGGGVDDCQACDAASTGGADGACAPLSATAALRVVCRAATDLCDRSEVCSPSSTACPDDGIAAAGELCRVAASPCDVPERCDGVSTACEADAWAPAGTECRSIGGPCDVIEVCVGTSPDCPADRFVPAGPECRASRGVCDPAELCGGDSPACPRDRRAPEGTSCADPDRCDGEEMCVDGACVPSTPLDCDDGNACTADACDAVTGCAHTPVDGCCLDDVDCVDADSCTEDRCSMPGGTCSSTPIAGCVPGDAGPVPLRDAGAVDGGVLAVDGGVIGPDAGSAPEAGGCGCRASGHAGAAGAPLLALGAGLAAARRRRRRRRSAS